MCTSLMVYGARSSLQGMQGPGCRVCGSDCEAGAPEGSDFGVVSTDSAGP
jgi:hypothetical protein